MPADWLLSWLREEQVADIDHARELIRDSGVRTHLSSLALEASQGPARRLIGKDDVLAGTGIDVSGALACYDPDCRSLDAEWLVRRTWHYFERCGVADRLTVHLAHHAVDEIAPPVKALERDVEVCMRLISLDADRLLSFRIRDQPAWGEDWEERATDLGIGFVVDRAREELAPVLADSADIYGGDGDEQWVLQHPSVHHMKVQRIPREVSEGMSEAKLRGAVAWNVVHQVFGYVIADLEYSRRANVPLIASSDLYGELLAPSMSGTTPAEVVLHLRMPMLLGAGTADLVHLRDEESGDFESLRRALRSAARERLREVGTGRDPAEIAAEIDDDVIEPELSRIKTRLDSAAAKLRRTAMLDIGVGTALTLVGILSQNGILASVGLAQSWSGAIKTGLGTSRSDVEVADSDLFMLFRGQTASHSETGDSKV